MSRNRKHTPFVGSVKAVQFAKKSNEKRLPPPLLVILVLVVAGAMVSWLLVPRFLSDRRTDPIETVSAKFTENSAQLTVPRLSTQSWEQLDDPSQDGWQTEVFNSKANAVLKKLGKLLLRGGPVDPLEVAECNDVLWVF